MALPMYSLSYNVLMCR